MFVTKSTDVLFFKEIYLSTPSCWLMVRRMRKSWQSVPGEELLQKNRRRVPDKRYIKSVQS